MSNKPQIRNVTLIKSCSIKKAFCQANTINQQNQFISNKNLSKSASTPMPADSHDYPAGRMLELQERSNIVTKDFSIII